MQLYYILNLFNNNGIFFFLLFYRTRKVKDVHSVVQKSKALNKLSLIHSIHEERIDLVHNQRQSVMHRPQRGILTLTPRYPTRCYHVPSTKLKEKKKYNCAPCIVTSYRISRKNAAIRDKITS